ncbi:hypothetical protein HHK36_020344 [Tetracentron sinense]|uniref:Uncharacterized protein n=1 Tax=Tetracentron sinense TaxID=13715 RepID=A0A835D8A1_TETSI|nr:hypothetical protein HHK36_020344 [Tetracentron sinense]
MWVGMLFAAPDSTVQKLIPLLGGAHILSPFVLARECIGQRMDIRTFSNGGICSYAVMCQATISVKLLQIGCHNSEWKSVSQREFLDMFPGTLISPHSSTPSNWVPVVDQVLLMVTLVLAYVAGEVAAEKAYFKSKKNILVLDAVSKISTSSGSSVKIDHQANSKYTWNLVKGKLMVALDAIEHDANLKNKDVNNISGNYEIVNRDDWLISFLSLMLEKLGDDTIVQNINLSGKEDLFEDALLS